MFGLVRVPDFSGSLSHTLGVPDNSPSVVNEHSRGQASPATMQSVYVNEERILFGGGLHLVQPWRGFLTHSPAYLFWSGFHFWGF